MTTDAKDLAALTTEIVSAYVANNAVSATDLPALINTVQGALKDIDAPFSPETPARLTAAQIRKSITPEAIISFIDGQPYKLLKRHVARHGMSLAEYKTRFGLPRDYPTTAPNYSALRSAMARAAGLGQLKAPPAAKRKSAGLATATPAAAAPRNGRAKKASPKPR